jgi:N-acetylneuraminate lyase
MKELKGLIAATFSPMSKDGQVNIDVIPAVVERLIDDGITGLYVCGSTGEGPSLSTEERKIVAQAYVKASASRIPVVIQVGHNSLAEAKGLAIHAQEIGADAISAVPPTYFKPDSLDVLVDCLCEITSAVPDMPFFYYHVPGLSGITIDMRDFVDKVLGRMPNFAGIKYSALTVHEFQDCLEYAQGRYQVLYGCDEMLLSGLTVGSYGSVGSTFNFAAPLYQGIIEAFDRGDRETAKTLQGYSVAMCRLLYQYRGQAAFKSMMKYLGCDCGPNRLPIKALSSQEQKSLRCELEPLGFFEWGRKKVSSQKGMRPVQPV